MVELKRLPDYTWKIPAPAGTWIISPDKHHAPPDDEEGGVDPRAFSCQLQGIQIVKPDGYVDLGDIGEWTSVSPWKYKRRSRPPIKNVMADVKRDLHYINKGMDQVDAVLDEVGCDRRVLIQGNHDLWFDYMVEEWQENIGDLMRDGMSMPDVLKLKERGYAYVPYGDYVKLGQLFLYHGGHVKSEKYHAQRHLIELSASVMYGHYHDYQIAKTGLLGKGLHAAWSIGFLGKPRKPFMKGKPTNWSHNFAVVHVEKSGLFHVEVVEIFDGKCYVQGKKVVG